MKKIAYFDCFAGISGDMVLGALVDAGLSPDHLREQLSLLQLPGWDIAAERVTRNGITGTKVNVITGETKKHRHLPEIESIIKGSDLSEAVKEMALKIFGNLADAEAAVHGVPREKIHFHEVGAIDAIIDITGASIGFDALGFDSILASPINTGSGFVRAAHGTLPVPAPATARLLEGMTIYNSGIDMELVTPTGAAIIKTVAGSSSVMPPLILEKGGYGAGSKEHRLPNLLRLFIGSVEEIPFETDRIVHLETNIDDSTPEMLGYLFSRLLDAGALDVYISPVLMKKNRPGQLLSVITPFEREQEISEIIFRESSSSGIRRSDQNRYKLPRKSVPVETSYGTINVKEHMLGGEVITVSPEFEDCRKLAESGAIPLQDIYQAALSAYQKRKKDK